MTTSIFQMTNEAGNLICFVDTRNSCGTLVASEPFASVADAERYATSLDA
jgi:hypothetical protein